MAEEQKKRIRHYIIVKFTEGTDAASLEEPVRRIFEETLAIPGIHALEMHVSNSDRANRYDMMILLEMDQDALPAYDSSGPHLRWKEEYGDRIDKKAIFDCDA